MAGGMFVGRCPDYYVIDMEVFVHSDVETTAASDFDVFSLRCNTWLHNTVISLFDNEEWRRDNLDCFANIPIDIVSDVTVRIDGDDYGSGWEWWIDSVELMQNTEG